MYVSNKKAFTMVELTFVIVIIGILSAIAIPKLAATRDDAVITKAKITVASLRNAISTERQLRILRGDFSHIQHLDSGNGNLVNSDIFDRFDLNASANRVLEYPLRSCEVAGSRGCWIRTADSRYTFRMPHNIKDINFDSNDSRFDCLVVAPVTQVDCDLLTR